MCKKNKYAAGFLNYQIEPHIFKDSVCILTAATAMASHLSANVSISTMFVSRMKPGHCWNVERSFMTFPAE